MKQTIRLSALAMVAGAFAVVPAAAQDQPGDRVNQLVIYGDDVCPQSTGDEIVVCARKDEGERFRIPETLRGGGLGEAKNQGWAERARSYEYVGKDGPQTCSAAGAFGFTGCTQKLLQQAYAEKGVDDTVNWGQLIEEERQKRLAGIDADADVVEARLREIERTREEREAAAEEARARLEAQDAAREAAANGSPESLARPPVADEAPAVAETDGF